MTNPVAPNPPQGGTPAQQPYPQQYPPQQYNPVQPGNAPIQPPAPGYQSTPQAPKKSFNWLRIVIPVVIIVVLIVGGYVVKHVTGDPDIAKKGDCLAGQTGDDIKVVDCNGGKAEWKVVDKVDNQSKPITDEDSEKACANAPGFQASFWKGKDGEKGYILCLAPVK